MEIVAFVARNKEQTLQEYICEFDEKKLKKYEKKGYLFFAEYEDGTFKQVSRGEVVNPNPTYEASFNFKEAMQHETN